MRRDTAHGRSAPPPPAPGRAGHQRGIGAIFLASGAVALLQMTLIIAMVEGWLAIQLSHRTTFRMHMGHFFFFIGCLALYLFLAYRAGERVSLQDLVDAAVGFLFYVFLFFISAYALAFGGAHSFFAWLPGLFHVVYGVQLIRRRPMFDLS